VTSPPTFLPSPQPLQNTGSRIPKVKPSPSAPAHLISSFVHKSDFSPIHGVTHGRESVMASGNTVSVSIPDDRARYSDRDLSLSPQPQPAASRPTWSHDPFHYQKHADVTSPLTSPWQPIASGRHEVAQHSSRQQRERERESERKKERERERERERYGNNEAAHEQSGEGSLTRKELEEPKSSIMTSLQSIAKPKATPPKPKTPRHTDTYFGAHQKTVQDMVTPSETGLQSAEKARQSTSGNWKKPTPSPEKMLKFRGDASLSPGSSWGVAHGGMVASSASVTATASVTTRAPVAGAALSMSPPTMTRRRAGTSHTHTSTHSQRARREPELNQSTSPHKSERHKEELNDAAQAPRLTRQKSSSPPVLAETARLVCTHNNILYSIVYSKISCRISI
jgi:hypothetical protein